jgi:hypothetical protein
MPIMGTSAEENSPAAVRAGTAGAACVRDRSVERLAETTEMSGDTQRRFVTSGQRAGFEDDSPRIAIVRDAESRQPGVGVVHCADSKGDLPGAPTKRSVGTNGTSIGYKSKFCWELCCSCTLE